ncbi:hypothetical protein, variant [Verruconis gallopava]|uniref:Uncharacterized protein n=1 Tax=Verruconis gallopava TaxID=253628 RepID=A0A0D2APR1_9PEZI|nr:uncharacterized protein PV09_00633 [Verruconis gallopava]XP_016218552.1 hypothetical protein, variant [Verruconis gallopava]KIW08682.1 hypothetical protein PV09_00633 [Verruconis gallopava]KIW08683.1 hypothetical protein, variant [Verruconis gallopava]
MATYSNTSGDGWPTYDIAPPPYLVGTSTTSSFSSGAEHCKHLESRQSWPHTSYRHRSGRSSSQRPSESNKCNKDPSGHSGRMFLCFPLPSTHSRHSSHTYRDDNRDRVRDSSMRRLGRRCKSMWCGPPELRQQDAHFG